MNEAPPRQIDDIRWHSRLSLRIVAVFLGLLVLVQVVTLALVRTGIDDNAREHLSEQLNLGEQVFMRLLHQNADHYIESTRVLALDFGFRTAISSNDQATITSALVNHGERLGAGFAVLTDTAGHIRASTTELGQATDGLVSSLMQQSGSEQAQDSSDIHVMVLDGRLFQLVTVPVKAPLTIGWVVMGFRLDNALLLDMRRLTGVDVVVLSRQGKLPWQSTLSQLPQASAQALLTQWSPMAEAVREQGKSPGMLALPEGDHVWRSITLEGPQGQEVEALLLRSESEAVAPYHRLEGSILLFSVLGVIVFAVGSAVTARRIVGPVHTLTKLAQRLSDGDYAVPVPQQGKDEIGALSIAFESMRQAMQQRESEIRAVAFTDGLTQMPNWARFSADVKEAVADVRQQPGSACAVLMLDLDRFKHVNDVLGHDTGDQLLQLVGQRLRRLIFDPRNTVARLSGDEFAVLLRQGDLAQAKAVARTILDRLDAPLMLNGQTVDLGAGIGIAVYPEHASDGDELIRRAEVAMYKAKQTHLGHIVFRPELDMRSDEALSLLGELRRAIEHQELRLFLQPKVCMASGEVKGAEALVRWQHPTRGMVPPMKFIPFAEQTGFIRQITYWLLEESARIWRQWADSGVRLDLSVNLSARDLIDSDLPAHLNRLLILHGVPPEHLCLEITESAIMDDPNHALQTLEQFHYMGVKMAIDDFGTGYSSLAYLKRLPVDELKIDKSFVMNMQHDSQDEKIVRSVIDLAHNMGLRVVAEGLEDRRAWEQLGALDCDLAQGYWIAKPMPSDQFIGWARTWQLPEAPEPVGAVLAGQSQSASA